TASPATRMKECEVEEFRPMGQENGSAAARRGDGALYLRLLRQARPYAPHLAALLALDLLDGLTMLLKPLPLKIAVDCVVGSRPLPRPLDGLVPESVAASPTALLAVAAGLLLGIALLSSLQAVASSLLRAYAGEKMVLGFRGELFRHAQRLSLSYHDA